MANFFITSNIAEIKLLNSFYGCCDPTGAWVTQTTESEARYNAWGSSRDETDGNGDWSGDFDPVTDFDNGGGSGFGGGGGNYSGDYNDYWNRTLSGIFSGHSPEGVTSNGTIPYYNYSNLSGDGQFETPNNDGVYTEQVGEMYHFIGAVDATSYTFTSNSSFNSTGRGSDGWETASTATEITDGAFGFVEALQRGSNAAQMIEGGGELKMISETAGRAASTTLGGINILFTAVDGITNAKGWQNHHTADILVSAGEIALGWVEATSPIGWALGVGMFVGNIVSEHYTGKSITENLFETIK